MPGDRSARRARVKGELKAAIKEFVRLMDQARPEKAATRLQLDMARDAGLDACRKMLRRLTALDARLKRARQRSDAARERHLTLLDDLASGSVIFPRPAGLVPADPAKLDGAFAELRSRDFPALAETLRTATGQAETIAYERYLAEEFFRKGSAILAEHLVREGRHPLPIADEVQFLDKLRHHLAGNVQQTLMQQSGTKVTQEVAQEIDAVLVRSLRFLLHHLTISPPRRLLMPTMGTDFDPELHEASPGRPTEGAVVIRTTIFPGCVELSQPQRVLAKALVYTRLVNGDTP